jgi:hypothetical protein
LFTQTARPPIESWTMSVPLRDRNPPPLPQMYQSEQSEKPAAVAKLPPLADGMGLHGHTA